MSTPAAALALHRFGLGPKPGDLAAIGGDPRGAFAAELDSPGVALLSGGRLLDTVAILAERNRYKELKMQASVAPASPMEGTATDMGAAGSRPPRPFTAEVDEAEITARIERAVTAQTGIGERLVAFWTNHFTVEGDAGSTVRCLAGALEREAIRPHVLGRFEDMLLAATRHPAMLVYLDTFRSVGPNSGAGQKTGRGLNENHARELLELHTVGIDAGYSQADVTAFARVLTGWTFRRRERDLGEFAFRAQSHEPGPQTVMGVSYAEAGLAQGEAVLRNLARHPATARHIAHKFARHFVADLPPPALVDRLAATFLETEGDLKVLAETLIGSQEAWGEPTKIKLPQEFLWSSLRALELTIDWRLAARAMKALGQPFWNPTSPAGFPDDSQAWLAADATSDRLDLAELLAERAPRGEPTARLDQALGPNVSAATRETVRTAASRTQALALLLMSPEFQRR